MSQPALKLNNGLQMPLLGFGTFLGKPGEIKDAVKAALKTGYKHLDCAYVYNNEKEIGETLKEVFADASYGLKREDIWITSKLSAYKMDPKDIEPCVRETLTNLQIDQLDLYLVHLPIPATKNSEGKTVPARVPLHEVWKGMEELVNKGLVKSIGVSNFTTAHINDLLSYAKIKPVVNQIERHPFLVQPDHVNFCRSNGIEITAYAPLGAPGYQEEFLKGKELPSLLKNEKVLALAKKYNKTPAQILIRWNLDDKVIAIPKSVKPERIAENFGVLDFNLEKNDWETLTNLNQNLRYFQQAWVGVPYFSP